MKYSVVIPTYNGSRKIVRLLYSLIRQVIDPNSFEILIIDDGSVDDTFKIVNEFIEKNTTHNIIYIYQTHKGQSAARNLGIKSSRGDLIFFTDDDCEVPAMWMENFIRIYEDNPEIVGVGGWYNPPLFMVRENIYHYFYYLVMRYASGEGLDLFTGKTGQYPYSLAHNSANISFKKWLLLKVGGFDERLPWREDVDLSERIEALGYKLYYTPIHVLHYKKLNLWKFIELCYRRARGQAAIRAIRRIKPGRKRISPISSVIQFAYFCRNLKNKYPDFVYRKSVIFCAIIWFFLFFVISLISPKIKLQEPDYNQL